MKLTEEKKQVLMQKYNLTELQLNEKIARARRIKKKKAILEGKMDIMPHDKKKGAAVVHWIADEFGEFDPDEFELNRYNDNIFEYDGQKWAVYTDDEADEAVNEDIENSIDDMGISAFSKSFQQDIIDNYIDDNWFYNALRKMEKSYVYDIKNESSKEFEDRLIEELYENGIISDDDFELDEDGYADYMQFIGDEDDYTEEYIQLLIDEAGDPVQYYIDEFGMDSVINILNQNPRIINIDEIVDNIIRQEGRGNILNNYNGYEYEYTHKGNTYYFYRQN